ncbi:MAG: type III-A CRISPR-associated RAMP protein Csm3 [Planctomycetota bacterium]|nr:MAG: type III-A CRISPR-associated RAMP protein Csm3 [Planctomycetota bacterium]
MANNYRMVGLRKISGKIRVVTGLRVGASQDTMEISGLDNPIIRNPADGMPYIPGSSIKGRMRALAEWYYGEIPPGGDPTQANAHTRTARVFGVSASKEQSPGPTRLIVRDAFLNDSWKERFRKGEPITEVKHENSINRLTAMANPRPMERVLPGVEFDFELVYRILEMGGEDEQSNAASAAADKDDFDIVLTALALVEADALGGAGSRGCGQVKFLDLRDESGNPVELPNITDSTKAAAG